MVKKLYYRLTLRRRLWASFLLLAVLSSALTGGVSYWIAYRSTEQEAAASTQNTLNKSAQLLNEKLRSVVVNASSMMLSEPFQDIMSDVYTGNSGTYYRRLSLLQTPLAQMKITDLSVHSVLIVTPLGEFYSTSDLRVSGIPFRDTFFSQRVDQMEENDRVLWIESHKDPLFLGGGQVISLVMKPVTDLNVKNVYVVVNLKEEALRAIMSDDLPAGASSYYLISGTSGKPVLDIGGDPQLYREPPQLLAALRESDKGFLKEHSGGETSLINFGRLDLARDWVMVSFQDQDELLKQVNKIKTTSLLIMAGCTLAALLAANGMSGFLLRPLIRLQAMMKQVENNNLEVRFQSRFDDEVAQVGMKFNRMLEEISSLIGEIKEAEAEKRRLAIKALQAQIDPHFLYNTLNTIIWKSVSSRNEEVTEMISSLSQLFQLGLNGGRELTTLDKELDHVRHYLNLQQQCYRGLFEYEIALESPALGEVPVTKILLQPLVENSILHGFKEQDSGGFIRISAAQTEGNLILSVEDNGKGMDTEVVESAIRSKHRSVKSYALGNIYDRLKLMHGEKADLSFSSDPGGVTRAVITIPVEGGPAHE